jgi:hypothetical protein
LGCTRKCFFWCTEVAGRRVEFAMLYVNMWLLPRTLAVRISTYELSCVAECREMTDVSEQVKSTVGTVWVCCVSFGQVVV